MNNNENIYKQKRQWYKFKLKPIDNCSPFDYNLVNLKNTGYIFLGTAVFIPFFISILISYLFAQNQYALIIINFISWIIVAIGSYFVINNAKNKIIKSGAIAFYFYYFIPNIISLIIGIITSKFYITDSVKTTINLLTSIISGIIIIILLYKTSPFIFEKIKLTFKQNLKLLIIVSIISIIIIFLVNFLFNYLQSLITTSNSNNQIILNRAIDKWWNIIILFIYTIIIAPFIEEIAIRHSIFSLTGNKWIGYVASSIFFAGMHVSSTGDWKHIIGYCGTAFVLGIIFIIINGNITYTIIIHSIFNFIILILLIFFQDFYIN